MKIIIIILLPLLLVVVGAGLYIYLNGPGAVDAEFKEFFYNSKVQINNQLQFYPNMRYKHREITYYIDPVCDEEKIDDVNRAFNILSQKTVLAFKRVNSNGEITISCSEIMPTTKEMGHFIAGEGGPSTIINASNFVVIIAGKISLFRSDRCDEPKIAIHEILHALGFNHINDSESIMYETTSCRQEIDPEIINEINRIYSIEPAPDLILERVKANITNGYLNFEADIINYGLMESSSSILKVSSDKKDVGVFELGAIDIGTRKKIKVENLRIPVRKPSSLTFRIEGYENEISLENNIAQIEII